MREIELKFQIPAQQRRALWAAFRRGPVTRTLLHAHYFDTSEGLLAKNRLALRLRREGDQWVQTLKASVGHGVTRWEHNAIVASDGAAVPALDIERHRASAAHEVLMKALQEAPDATSLQEVYRTEVIRRAREFKAQDGEVVEAAFDEGRVVAGASVHPICELEFELKAGPLSALFDQALPWVERHGLWFDTVSKAERGYLMSRGRLHAEPVKARAPNVDAKTDAPGFVRQVVSACLMQVLPNASAVAGGSHDPDHGHQLRVGLRRLRTALRELPELNAGLDPAWEAPLAVVFRKLGADRDQLLAATQMADALKAAGAPDLPQFERPSGEAAAQAVQAVDFQCALLAALAFAMNAAPVSASAFEGLPAQALGDRLDQLQRKLRHRAKRFIELPASDQHRLRKQLKRLRYLAEFISPFFGRSRTGRYFDALKPAQDALGVHNDQAMAMMAYRREATHSAAAWFAVGWLSARQQASAEEAARALAIAGKAHRFWIKRTKKAKSTKS